MGSSWPELVYSPAAFGQHLQGASGRAALRGAGMAPAALDPAELPFSERRRIFSGGASCRAPAAWKTPLARGACAAPACRPPRWPPPLVVCAGGARAACPEEASSGHQSPLSVCSTDAGSTTSALSIPEANCPLALAEVEEEPEPEEASGGACGPATGGHLGAVQAVAVEEQCVARIALKLQRLAGRVESLEDALVFQQRAGSER